MPTQKLTPEIITAAIEGYEHQKLRIDAQITGLRAMLSGGDGIGPEILQAPTVKRKLSAASRRRMKEAQQNRWNKIRGLKPPAEPAKAAKPKRKLSAAGKAAIVAALKKRWAVKKAETDKAKRVVAKKSTKTASVKTTA